MFTAVLRSLRLQPEVIWEDCEEPVEADLLLVFEMLLSRYETPLAKQPEPPTHILESQA